MKRTVQESGVSHQRRAVIERDAVQALIDALGAEGYAVIGPRRRDGAIVYDPLTDAADLPWGWIDEQEGGRYRLHRDDRGAAFGHVVGPQSWKKYLYPPRQTLWTGRREGGGFTVETPQGPPPRYAFLGVRGCELAAIAVQDRVFGVVRHDGRSVGQQQYTDSGYAARRAAAFIVAVNCGRAAGTCFCDSIGTGPQAGPGYDLCLTELIGDGRHEFLVEAGSDRGAVLLDRLPARHAEGADLEAAAAVTEAARAGMGRRMEPDVAGLLARNLEHPRWDEVAGRCLSCANCTMVCPTCFCTTVEDTTDLTGDHVERWRRWDSCFTVDFSYIHGGSIRQGGASRYRQWMTHKLSSWYEQFGTSGCTGCGRCITWCPVGIDITEEARAIRASEGGASDGAD
ncbi:sulfite reductase subunit A [Azospirillum sp. RWY-5-1]|uniref:Sulfite reductase subunit A n=1 Tax=Azospirillum oleiclasticum TaxID=2735135 RepID=A0ABX2TL22_9PROT|nr:4Fe-4S dicluster domain-containing protein [Azospirillum oleiclasticum]NYZ16427.1 sulfite reductase subunit A [Azospirillum oleiclasticum]NYZ23857.1 sulfite reductase subunit A [Azospirillum oleiclasticum]